MARQLHYRRYFLRDSNWDECTEMVTLLEILLSGFALGLLMSVAVLFAEVLFAVPRCSEAAAREAGRRRLTVVMPAHNEASIIANTLRSLLLQLTKLDRLVVV